VCAKKAELKVYENAGFKLVGSVIQDASKYGIQEEYGAYFLVQEFEEYSSS
jgi:hypothetical protein